MFRFFIILSSISFYLIAGTIEGNVSYAGSKKTAKSLKMDSDPICGISHSVPPKKEDFILNDNNQFKNVIIVSNSLFSFIAIKKFAYSSSDLTISSLSIKFNHLVASI